MSTVIITQATNPSAMKYLDILKIYPIAEDLNYILHLVGVAFSGVITWEQMAVFLIGNGSNGKSFLMEIVQGALDEYVSVIDGALFNPLVSESEKCKIMNKYKYNRQYRISWINEPKNDKLDGLFKKWIDGQVTATEIYHALSSTFYKNTLTFCTNNHMSTFCDTTDGTILRMNVNDYKSTFIVNSEELYKVNEKITFILQTATFVTEFINQGNIVMRL
jgi:hypothetical protein